MKTKLLILLLFTNFVFCQVTDLLTNLNTASNLTYKDNYVYFNSYSGKKIFRFDYSLPNPTAELILQLNENPNFVYAKDNFLYVGVENPHKTYKIDLSSENFQPQFLANVAGPMTQINGDLYIGQYTDSKIVKVDLTTNLQSDVLVGYKPNFFTAFEGHLYFTSNYTNKLYKLDVTTSSLEVVLNNLNYASGIVMNTDLFFVCESSASTISIYTKPDFQFQEMVQLPVNSWPNGVILIGNDLVFVQTITGKISKMPINSFLGHTSFVTTNPKIKVYPNPSSDVIKIESQYTFEKYQIYDLQGKLIENEIITNNRISISHLSKGEYVLMLDKHSNTFLKN
ncbi:T9SS type A sorting domain-containing protein [Flavobacterium sp. J27]|uniref:T9SS type A sorting domain-containing protein n=1 Tax=Flavobacterium sp. J27 TaxID=2060419 RepID=UPI001031F5B4|nr:T9SS type A sorting domain-containing protein [Flavobacterium sp. J27]